MSEISNSNRRHYGAIDGLRSFSAIGIVMMHVLSNGNYHIDGFFFEKVIPSFGNLVFLFMIISGFAMCCGYYDKIIHCKIAVEEFYKKRYLKIWPFFAFLCVIDFVLSPSKNALYEVFANLTLCFGLLPNPGIEVIGVGWFLGVVFAFYLMFPFFCSLLSSKRRAWISFVIALVFNYLCGVRFSAGRNNIIFSAVFFLAGGLIYLYKNELSKIVEKAKWFIFTVIVIMLFVYYSVGDTIPIMLVIFGLMLIYVLGDSSHYLLMNNFITKFLSKISMEVYLCHMVIFRVIEKMKFTHLFESDLLSYFITTIATVAGTIIFSVVVKIVLENVLLKKEKIIWRKRS